LDGVGLEEREAQEELEGKGEGDMLEEREVVEPKEVPEEVSLIIIHFIKYEMNRSINT
jgi:hypothetical protein